MKKNSFRSGRKLKVKCKKRNKLQSFVNWACPNLGHFFRETTFPTHNQGTFQQKRYFCGHGLMF